jgi:predicted signal transduction protein with EAL and GGDEF domain
MWVYPTVPDKMLMVIAMIFGAHLLPYGWLYKSKSYMAFSVVIPILALVVGLMFEPYILAAMMLLIEILFSLLLFVEIKRMQESRT